MKKATVLFFVVATTLLDLGLSTAIHDVVHTSSAVDKTVVIEEVAPVHNVHETVVKKTPAVQEELVIVQDPPAVQEELVIVQDPPAVQEELVIVQDPPAVQEELVIVQDPPAVALDETVIIEEEPVLVQETVIESPPTTVQHIDIEETVLEHDDK